MKHYKFLIATLLLLLCIADMVWWFNITSYDLSFEEMKLKYVSIFPPFLQHIGLLTVILIVFLVGAALLFMQSRKENGLKFVASGGMILSFVLAFCQLFSLM